MKCNPLTCDVCRKSEMKTDKKIFLAKSKTDLACIKIDYEKKEWCALEVKLTDKDSKMCLSICGSTGHVGPKQSRLDDVYAHAKGKEYLIVSACGQIRDELNEWFPEYKEYFKWHLNDMNAGCIHQREYGWRPCPGFHNEKLNEICNHIPVKFPLRSNVTYSFGRCWKDAVNVPCPECGYKYGTQWLYEPLPKEVIDWVYQLEERFFQD